MNAMTKPTAKPKAMPNRGLTADGAFMLPRPGNLAAIPVAANSDLFDDWTPELLEILGNDQLPWEDDPQGIEEAWSRVQDIWLRLARHPGIACTTLIDAAQGEQLVVFLPKGAAIDSEGARLLEMAACSSTYRWCEQDRQGSLVSHVAWCGDTLVIDLTPFEQMQAWPGESLVWQVQGLLRRLGDLGGRA